MAAYVNNPALTYTLEQFISMRYTDETTYRNLSILEVKDGIEMLDHNLIDDYMDELLDLCKACPLTDEQYKKYRYSPDLLAFDVYGSTQLDFVILKINGMIDPKEFDLKVVKLPFRSKLLAFLSNVYNANADYIKQNRADNNLKNYV